MSLIVAIPSYSEVLFLLAVAHALHGRARKSQSLLIQRSYSYEYEMLHSLFSDESQSLLIQRSYSYEEKYEEMLADWETSQSLLIQRSYSYCLE